MKHIMLVCNAGMSTSMLVTKMQKAAEETGLKQLFGLFQYLKPIMKLLKKRLMYYS